MQINRVCVVSNEPNHASTYGRHLVPRFAVQTVGLDELDRAKPDALTVVDVDLNDAASANALRTWLRQRPKESAAIFAINKGSRIQAVRAYSIGATDIVFRPVCPRTLISKLVGNGRRPTSGPSDAVPTYADGIAAGLSALEHVFASASADIPLSPKVIEHAGEALVSHIEAYGFADWVEAVRAHHSQTYQHCLLVSGAAAAFASHLRFNGVDRRRVAVAGLLHDIGKAKLPVAILDKPAELDEEEMAAVRQHAAIGHKALQSVEGLQPEMLDMVLHHHEYLDGSGYPHGLHGGEISDLTRIVTITDIFAALIEHRAYRASMSGSAAYQVLLDMGPKLDRDLVRAFQPLSRAQFG
jgi:putative nucleotidyltransferase with HDIG domain